MRHCCPFFISVSQAKADQLKYTGALLFMTAEIRCPPAELCDCNTNYGIPPLRDSHATAKLRMCSDWPPTAGTASSAIFCPCATCHILTNLISFSAAFPATVRTANSTSDMTLLRQSRTYRLVSSLPRPRKAHSALRNRSDIWGSEIDKNENDTIFLRRSRMYHLLPTLLRPCACIFHSVLRNHSFLHPPGP